MFKPEYWTNFAIVQIHIFGIILSFTSSSPSRKDQFAVLYPAWQAFQAGGKG